MTERRQDTGMERHIDQDLDQVRQDLLRMAAEVEGMVTDVIRALLERDSEAAEGMTERDHLVDELEKRIQTWMKKSDAGIRLDCELH